jgi:tetratricopeptide (TPR) repeat protein
MFRLLAILVVLCCPLLSTSLGNAEEVKALRMIIVRDKLEAQKILQQLRKGTSFSALAGRKSIGPERRLWGYSGIVRLADVQPKLRPILRKLKPGQISGVLQLGEKFVIVKVISPQIERHYEAAERAMREQQTARAIRELKAALRLEKDNVQTYLRLGMVYENAKRYEEAIPYMEKAQHYAPQATQIAILRGTVYMRAAIKHKNRTYAQKALRAYKQALQQDEGFAPAIHFGIGKVYLVALQQPEMALSHLEQAVAVSPNVPEVYRLLIQAYYDTRRYQKAWQHLRLAQSLGFEFPELRDALYKVKRQSQR